MLACRHVVRTRSTGYGLSLTSSSSATYSARCMSASACRFASSARPVAKANLSHGISSSNQTGKGASSVGNSAASASSRTRKLTPTAKAKAQASASRALREQLQAAGKSTTTLEPDDVHIARARAAGIERTSAADEGLLAAAVGRLSTEENVVEKAIGTSISSPVRRIRDVYAYATAEAYDFDVLIQSGRLPAGWQLIQDGEVIYIPHWPMRPFSPPSPPPSEQPVSFTPAPPPGVPGVGEAFIFRSGSYVTWGINNEQSRRFARTVVRGRQGQGANAEVESYKEIGDEAMEYVIAEDQFTRVVGDVIVIGQKPRAEEELEGDYVDGGASGDKDADPDWSPLLARLAFSQGLCRSARLSVQEAALNAYLEEVADMPARLEAEGKVPLARRQVIRKMGTLLKLRQRANLDTENFLDDPEMYWENSELEHHYDSICLALDIETRFKAYNEKLDHGENLLGVLRALLTESSTHRMELIIIYLIAMEVCMALISHEYIPSPAIVYDLASQFFTGHPIEQSTLTSASDVSNSSTALQTNVSSSTTGGTSYWQWLKSYIPGFQASATNAPGTHVV